MSLWAESGPHQALAFAAGRTLGVVERIQFGPRHTIPDFFDEARDRAVIIALRRLPQTPLNSPPPVLELEAQVGLSIAFVEPGDD